MNTYKTQSKYEFFIDSNHCALLDFTNSQESFYLFSSEMSDQIVGYSIQQSSNKVYFRS
jgi:hypothetical protein